MLTVAQKYAFVLHTETDQFEFTRLKAEFDCLMDSLPPAKASALLQSFIAASSLLDHPGAKTEGPIIIN